MPATGNKLAPAAPWAQGFFTPANAIQVAPNANSTQSTAYNAGENIAGFNTSFDFMFTGSEGADGLTFTIQADSQSQVGGGGGSLGYDGTGHSVAVYFQQYNGSAMGLGINGSRQSAINIESQGFNFSSSEGSAPQQNESDVYNASLKYDNTAKTLTVVLTDETKTTAGVPTSVTEVFNVDIPKVIGMNNAFVGFTGANGGAHSEKDILNWTYSHASSVLGTLSETITLPSGTNSVSISTDGTNDLWTLGGVNYYMPLTDAVGLTVNGNGAADTIGFSGDSALPNKLKLGTNTGGNFTLNGLSGNFMSGKTLDIGKNKVFVSYASGSDPIANIQQYLKTGYNNGTNSWAPAPSAIISSSIASSKYAIGYADSADANSPDTTANTVELMYTLAGDADLSGSVNALDLGRLLSNYNKPGAWDQGDFDYSGSVNALDLGKLLSNYNQNA